MSNFLTEKTLIHIAESTWNKIIKKYEEYGTISSGIIMTLIVMQLIKMLVDMIIRGYAIQKLYGCSNHLFGSIVTSVTHLLVVLNKINDTEKINKKNNKEGTSSELQEIVVTKPTISMPVKEHNSEKIEHELREVKPRKVINLRPLPPLPTSPPVVTYATNSTSASRKRPEIEVFGT